MPVVKQKPTKRKRVALLLRGHKVLSALVVLALAGVIGAQIWHVREQRAASAERARFAAAEQDIDAITARIIAEIGQPLKVDKDKYCSRPNTKFDNGPLSCDVELRLIYPSASESHSSSLYKRISELLSRGGSPTLNMQFHDNLGSQRFTQLEKSINEENEASYLQINEKIGLIDAAVICRANYWEYMAALPPYPELAFSTMEPKLFGMRLNCSAESSVQHFPMKN